MEWSNNLGGETIRPTYITHTSPQSNYFNIKQIGTILYDSNYYSWFLRRFFGGICDPRLLRNSSVLVDVKQVFIPKKSYVKCKTMQEFFSGRVIYITMLYNDFFGDVVGMYVRHGRTSTLVEDHDKTRKSLFSLHLLRRDEP